MKKLIRQLGVYVDAPEDYLVFGSDPLPISWAFYVARRHGMRYALAILAEVNQRRQKAGTAFVSFL